MIKNAYASLAMQTIVSGIIMYLVMFVMIDNLGSQAIPYPILAHSVSISAASSQAATRSIPFRQALDSARVRSMSSRC